MSVLHASALNGWDDTRPALTADQLADRILTSPRHPRPRHRHAWCANCGSPASAREHACPRCGENAIVTSHRQAADWQDWHRKQEGGVL